MEVLMRKINRDTIYMQYPSSWWHDQWREELVSGNGRTGAGVYGGVKTETVMITNHALWHGGSEQVLPDVSKDFQQLRRKMEMEEFQEASWTVVNALKEKGYRTRLQAFLPLADLTITYGNNKGFTHYRRGIQMDTGEVWSEWMEGDATFSSELFVSRAEDLIIKRIRCEHSKLCLQLHLDQHRNQGSRVRPDVYQHITDTKECRVQGEYLIYTAKNDDGKDYGALVRVLAPEGCRKEIADGMEITGCSKVILVAAVFVKENKEKGIQGCISRLATFQGTYESYLRAHIVLHRNLYRSCDISFCSAGRHGNEELLLEAYRNRQTPELIEKMWRYGRYVFISGTCEDGSPFPLYGLWGGDYRLRWCHNMANENIQMIYWHTFTGNLLPLHKPFFRYNNSKMDVFRDNAAKIFGMKGIWVTPGTTPDISAPNQIVPVIMNWTGAGGWLAQHYYRYHLYERDPKYLCRELLPFMREIAAFYQSFLCYDKNGMIRIYPSVSPENTPENFMPEDRNAPHPMPTTVNATIDLAIVKEVFTNMCEIAEKEHCMQEELPAYRYILQAIPSYQRNEQGAVREWQDDRFKDRYDHRHLSHIYPVFPGQEVNQIHEKELLPAFEKAVKLRKIESQTGWSLAHMAAIYARFEKGNTSMKCLDQLARSCLLSNFFTLHNDWRQMDITLSMDPSPVQLDALMGYVNAVQEMLLYSSKDLLKLLPALPDILNRGSVKHLRYTCGFVSMQWNKKRMEFAAEIRAIREQKLFLKLPQIADHDSFICQNCEIKKKDQIYQLTMQKDGILKIQQTK